MAEVKKILFAVELSSLSPQIAQWANLMGKQFNVEVHVLHIVPEIDYWGVAYAVPPSRMDDRHKLIQEAEKKLEEFSEQNLDTSINLKTKVGIGSPAEEIIKYATEQEISLLIIGTHGKSGLDRAIFGSVADRVLRFSPVPVLCVNPHSLAC